MTGPLSKSFFQSNKSTMRSAAFINLREVCRPPETVVKGCR